MPIGGDPIGGANGNRPVSWPGNVFGFFARYLPFFRTPLHKPNPQQYLGQQQKAENLLEGKKRVDNDVRLDEKKRNDGPYFPPPPGIWLSRQVPGRGREFSKPPSV